ncbi:MAG: PASTA domain-containing protein [Actinobacteria bacterium]|nr:PASTA domain-containing protein [Actinomycetota bacterium]
MILFTGGLAGYVLFHDDKSDSSPPATPSADPAGARVGCQVGGFDLVTVPDLIRQHLGDAVAIAQASGLQVVENGVPIGDPSDASAVVRAQAPASGTRVPAGACIGFRTDA